MNDRHQNGGRGRGVVASILTFAGSLLAPGVVRGEVMDKEPTVAALWWTAAVGGLVGALLWSRSRWLGLAGLVVGSLLFVPTYLELRDPFVGPAITREAGPEYERSFWQALSAFVCLHGLGVFWWARARRTETAAGAPGVAPRLGDLEARGWMSSTRGLQIRASLHWLGVAGVALQLSGSACSR